MSNLLPEIRNLNKRNIINDLKIIDKSSIPHIPTITAAYKRICDKVRIGSQYEYLSRLAASYPSIEIGVEAPNGEFSGCNAAIDMLGAIKAYNGVYIIDTEVSSEDLVTLFGNMQFPIIKTTETQMTELIHIWNCEDIMKKIWFCHSPINDLPCGFCRACQQKMECEMEWLLPSKGQKRYKVYKKLTSIFGDRVGTKLANLMRRMK